MVRVRGATLALIVSSAAVLAACSAERPFGPTVGDVFGGGSRPASKSGAQTGIGVNAYLWRASLDTISFMPLTSADPWGGVIITDWYANPQTPDEHFKVTIFILDSRLRADALNVSIQKEVRAGDRWVPADVSQQTQLDIENAILTRARELRLSNVKN